MSVIQYSIINYVLFSITWGYAKKYCAVKYLSITPLKGIQKELGICTAEETILSYSNK